jgi:hypothetical protein
VIWPWLRSLAPILHEDHVNPHRLFVLQTAIASTKDQ